MVGNIVSKHCEVTIQTSTCYEQMRLLGKGAFVDTLCRKILGFVVPYILPDDFYYICGRKAYKWLSPNSQGTCFIGRVVPEVLTLTHDKMVTLHSKEVPPYAHVHYDHRDKREVRRPPAAENLISESTGFQILVQLDITRTARGILNYRYIHALAQLLDNITTIYDSTFRYTGMELQAFKQEIAQHRMVLDYLTAVTGGYCATLATQFGVKCCTYITNNTDDPREIIDRKMDEILQLKWDFRKAHNMSLAAMGEKLAKWVSWLNPANWFSGMGSWAQGLAESIGKFLMFIIIIIVVIVIGIKCIGVLLMCSRRKTKVMAVVESGEETAETSFYGPTYERRG